MLYLSQADVKSLNPLPGDMRRAIAEAFRAHHMGKFLSLPKLSLDISPAHKFQSLCAASPDLGLAVNKWLGVAPTEPGSTGRGIEALLVVNDFRTGEPLTVMDGNAVTGFRTAAMSAVAAEALASSDVNCLGFVGCGLQARHHLSALLALFPHVSDILAFSRGSSRDEFAEWALFAHGRRVRVCRQADEVVRHSGILVTSVPAGSPPFLDAEWVPAGAFVAAVDLARSFNSEGLGAIEFRVTDDHEQERAHPLYENLRSFDADLGELSHGSVSPAATQDRRIFIFRGHAVADLAAAALIHEMAWRTGVGSTLSR
ncbi:ornithine cyclodeaminase family protein [Aureimonas sp. ME7]|uniref:ornithine cyclodeaminase family protein n=1 Tax=Aureimonas sp. ME7 TaxID=2744252 RepID=UPI0015FDDBF1|nr:ornithine cyclodeaminase family protein [Aureimonas sp. ME7]